MKIAVMGSGAVGGYFGALLSRAGFDVTFIARGAHLGVMLEKGLEIRSALDGFQLHPVKATDEPVSIGVVDLLLFAVKSWDTEAAARAVRSIVGPVTAVISIQNGVENHDVLRSVFDQGRLLGGVSYVSSKLAGPGVITHTGVLRKLVFGDEEGRCSDVAKGFLGHCTAAGIEAEIRRDIREAIWEKFVFLVGLSATTAGIRLPIGPVRSNPRSRRLLLEIMQEVVAVGRAHGVHLPSNYAEDRLAFCDTLPPDMTSSMYKDLERGQRLELNWLSGSVARLGERVGVPTPANAFISDLLAPLASGA